MIRAAIIGAALAACDAQRLNATYCEAHPHDIASCTHAGEACSSSAACGPLGVCDPTALACVECLDDPDCPASDPICDGTTCRPCGDPRECATACRADGTCRDAGEVAFVDGDLGTDGTDCTEEQPCRTVTRALATGRPVARLRGSIVDSAVVDRDVELLGDATWSSPGTVLTVTNGARVALRHVTIQRIGANVPMIGIDLVAGAVTLADARISNTTRFAIRSAGSLAIDRVSIDHNDGIGIASLPGSDLAIAHATLILNGAGGALATMPATLDVTNAIVAGNGGAPDSFGGLQLDVTGTAAPRLAFVTVAANHMTRAGGTGGGIACTGGPAIVDAVIAGNDLRGSATVAGAQVSAGCDAARSTTGTALANLGIDPATYHLQAHSALIDAAVTTIPDDVDGDPRGAAPDVGADEYGE